MRVRIVLVVFAAFVVGWSGSASAEKRRVGVPKFDGPQEGVVRKAVMQVLKGDGYEVVGAKEIDGAAKSTGAQLDSNDGFKAVAKELSISAFVTGEVSKKKAKLTVRNGADGSVSGEGSFGGANPNKVAGDVRDGFGRRLGSAVERGRAPTGAKKPTAAPVAEAEEPDEKEAPAEAPAKASKPVPAAPPPKSEGEEKPPASSEAPPAETAEKKAPEPEGEAGAVGPRALDISLGFGGVSRNLSYNQDLYGVLRQYKLALGPAFVAHVILYPAAFTMNGFLANIGLETHIEQNFAITSSVPPTRDAAGNPIDPFMAGATFQTLVHDYYGGARVRLVLAGGHELALVVGGGEQAFAFRDDPTLKPGNRGGLNIPDAIYRYVRAGVDTRFELPSGVTAGLSGAYRIVLNQAGQMALPPVTDMNGNVAVDANGNVAGQGFFPYLTVAGVDFQGTLGYHITPSIEARVSVNLRRYFYTMHSSANVCPVAMSAGCDFITNPVTNMPERVNGIAGGAVDQYIGFNFGAAYVFGGAPPGGASGSEEPAAESAPKKKKKKKKKGGDEDEGDAGGGDSGGDDDKGGGDSDE